MASWAKKKTWCASRRGLLSVLSLARALWLVPCKRSLRSGRCLWCAGVFCLFFASFAGSAPIQGLNSVARWQWNSPNWRLISHHDECGRNPTCEGRDSIVEARVTQARGDARRVGVRYVQYWNERVPIRDGHDTLPRDPCACALHCICHCLAALRGTAADTSYY
jgi:hypothetical protein